MHAANAHSCRTHIDRQQHQQSVRQNFQKNAFSRSADARRAQAQEKQTRLQYVLSLDAQRQQATTKKPGKKDIQKSLGSEFPVEDTLEIVIELV